MTGDRSIHSPIQIAVSGALGFIGRQVVARLVEKGAQIWAVDRLPKPKHFPDGVDFRCVDLAAEPDAIPPADVLVHLAWNMDRADVVGQSKAASDFARLLESDKWKGVVGLGSAEEYGEREGRLREDMAPGTKLSAYGQAKHAAGNALESWARGAGRKAVWLRPFVVYGPGQGGNMAIPFALRCARERTTGDFSEGLQFRDFVHVADVAEGIAQATLELLAMKPPFAVCNLGRGEPVRLRDVLERIAHKMDAQDLFRFGARPMRPGEPQKQHADVAAAAELFGWRAKIPWEQGIDALCRESLR